LLKGSGTPESDTTSDDDPLPRRQIEGCRGTSPPALLPAQRPGQGGEPVRELRGRVAVITGAASGIGRAVAERCAGAGMKVALADVDESALAAAERAFKDAGAEVLGVRTDVSRADEVEALAGRAVERFGAVHLVHNNAGVSAGGLMWELPLADWKWVLGVNLWGVIHGVRTF